MLPQESMIERLRELCLQDKRLIAAMLYGSFWRWGNENVTILAERHSVALPVELVENIGRRINQLAG